MCEFRRFFTRIGKNKSPDTGLDDGAFLTADQRFSFDPVLNLFWLLAGFMVCVFYLWVSRRQVRAI